MGEVRFQVSKARCAAARARSRSASGVRQLAKHLERGRIDDVLRAPAVARQGTRHRYTVPTVHTCLSVLANLWGGGVFASLNQLASSRGPLEAGTRGANDAGARERLPAFHEISPDVGMITNDHPWNTFVFAGYGTPRPATWHAVPGPRRPCCAFPDCPWRSRLHSRTRHAHPLQRGPYNGVLRLHLALSVPEMPGSAGAMDQNRATLVRRLPRPWALD